MNVSKPGGKYVLFVSYFDGAGSRRRQWWSRDRRMWVDTQHADQGYASCSVAAAQSTKMERAHWHLPESWTVFDWGYQWFKS